MQLGQALAARSQWYDRNLSLILEEFTQGITPAAKTARNSYTVPANRKCHLSMCQYQLYRSTVATASGLLGVWFELTESGGAAQDIVNHWHELPAVNDVVKFAFPFDLTLSEGDNITIYTRDTSTLGIVTANISFIGTEFDA